VTASCVRLVEPAFRHVPEWVQTLGPEVADIAREAGFAPDPEQQLALDALFGFDRQGKSVAFELAVVAPRQNMKTGFFKQAALGWLFVTDQRLVIWSAHEFNTAQEAFRDMTELIEGCPYLDRRVKQIHRGNGDEAIELLGGQRLKFKARTKSGGRGLTGNKVVLDEAFALQPTHMGALLPTLTAVVDPQVVYGSSAGLAESDVLRSIRDRGRAGGDPSLGYFEWCDDLPGGCVSAKCDHATSAVGCRLDDRARWARANTQYDRRIAVGTLVKMRAALPPAEFAREVLGWWDQPGGAAVIPAGLWGACEDPGSKVETRIRFGLDVAPDHSWAAVGVAGIRPDGLPHIETTSRDGVLDHREGTAWVVPRLVELKVDFPDLRVSIIAGGAAEALVPALEAAGIDVDVIPSNKASAACGLFYDLATVGKLRHIGQPSLTQAIKDACQLWVADKAFTWGRRKSAGDITELYATNLALWACIESPDIAPTAHYI
jgi:hypothetical protein